jgi:hypothetical protein
LVWCVYVHPCCQPDVGLFRRLKVRRQSAAAVAVHLDEEAWALEPLLLEMGPRRAPPLRQGGRY